MGLVALSVLVFDRTESAMATTGFFISARFLPALLAPALVARVDQLAVRRVLPVLYAIEALVFALLALQVDHFALPLVLTLALFDGTLALAGRSLSRGTVAAVLRSEEALRDGNALLNIAFGLASVTGLIAGGIIISAGTLQAALLLDAGSFLSIALVLALTRSLPQAAPSVEREPYMTRLRGGLAFAARKPLVRSLLAWQSAALVFFTIVIPIEVIYAKETLGTSDSGFGVLLATWSAGILAGSLLYLRVRRARPMSLVVGSTVLIGLAYIGMGLVRSLGPACAFGLVGGIGNGIQWVAVMTLLQLSVPADLQARMAGLLESAGAAMPALGFLIGGVVTAIAAPPTAFLTAGCGVLVLAGLALLSPLPRLRPESAAPEVLSGGMPIAPRDPAATETVE